MRARIVLLGTLLGIVAVIAPTPCRAEGEWGFYVNGSRGQLAGSSRTGFDSTRGRSPAYTDAYGAGSGARVGVFRAFLPNTRWEAGLFYERWSGKPFSSDLFPQGATFGDLSIAGAAGGIRLRFLENHRVRVIMLGHAGLVTISKVNVTVAGQEEPYWKRTRSVFFDLGVGIECRLHRRVNLVADVRLESFGRPDSDLGSQVRSDADEASAYPITLGLEILLNRRARRAL
jgi:hypothetical protein